MSETGVISDDIEAMSPRIERLTPLTPFFGCVTARIPAAEATGLRFWLLTLAEHGIFIAANLPCDRPDLSAEARRLTDLFCGLLERPSPGRGNSVLDEAVRAAQIMLRYKERLLNMVIGGDLIMGLPSSTLLHMIGEAKRFIAIGTSPDRCIEPLMSAIPKSPLVNLLGAEHFWLDDQAGHAQMLQQAVDPVQLRYMEEARSWEELLRHLAHEGRALKKMAKANPPEMPVAARFSRDAVGATIGKRDFAWDTYELRQANQLLGTQPALLAYHMARESEHARLVIEALAGACL
ncbi:MAG: DUF2935 domain-containing protein [Bacillota bacterium]